MLTKRILLFLPLIIVLVLLQSFFWVPTYDQQGKGNPKRLRQFIQSSIGDAQILNPILSADTASSDINDKVFDGLIGLDDQLNYRPRLATDWRLYEEAYLHILPGYRVRGHTLNTGEDWMRFLREILKDKKEWWKNVESMELLPEEELESRVHLPQRDSEGAVLMEKGRPKMQEIGYTLHRPRRIKFTLRRIDQYFFDPIRALLGEAYFNAFPYSKYIRAENSGQQEYLEPAFPEILPVIEHNPVIVFNLRQGVRFHDGHEFNSGDVLFTFNAIMNPQNASPRTSDYEPVKSAEVLGPHQIKFVYKRLFSPAIDAWMMGVLPEHLLNEEALRKEASGKGLSPEQQKNFSMRDSEFNRHPVGTGPFVFQDWKGDVSIRLVRNEDYWEGPAEYEEYVMRIIPDPLTQEMEFYSGAADGYGVQPHQVARLKNDPKYQNFSTVGFTFNYIGYNLRNPLFADREVRTALGMAIDVDTIIQFVLYGQGERVTGPFAKVSKWYDQSLEPVPYDPQRAVEILNGLGWEKNEEGWLQKDGRVFEFNLITNNGNPIRKNIMTIVQNSWRKIGIKCNTQLFEWAVFLKDFVNALKFDALILGWSMGINPDLYQIWHSSQTHPNQLNFVGYTNPEADRLIVAIRREYDQARQMELTRQLHRVIAKDQPYTFLFVNKATQLLDKKIVIVERQEDGSEKHVKIYPTKGGNIQYYFNKWRKLSEAPQFSAN